MGYEESLKALDHMRSQLNELDSKRGATGHRHEEDDCYSVLEQLNESYFREIKKQVLIIFSSAFASVAIIVVALVIRGQL